ncbi:MAG TPA: cupin domain-containing protein [Micromonosporaceae bacterium]|jgi:mannose-6-phosphate isomerase-like protein (cupin superfamily)
MPFVRSSDTTLYEIHGTRFHAYAHSGSGASQLAAWITEVPVGTPGTPHTVDREEILRIAGGRVRVVLNGDSADLEPGDVAIVPAGSELRVDNLGPEPAIMWATTSIGLAATMADGSTLNPPWAN